MQRHAAAEVAGHVNSKRRAVGEYFVPTVQLGVFGGAQEAEQRPRSALRVCSLLPRETPPLPPTAGPPLRALQRTPLRDQ